MRTSPSTTSGMAIGRRFLRFFEERGHTVVPSGSLVPAGDPTLLFTNAGMVQFKDVFLGVEPRSYRRAVTNQRCLRVSGKHNDLEAVGPSPRHQTLFFMLGNFSFGDYFKREAIAYAWEFVTRDLSIDPDRILATVFEGDDESYGHWRTIGIPKARIFRMGEKTNFWAMGPTGPCGPNSELIFDRGPDHCTCGRPDCSVALDNDCDRWSEIWNLVFMQYNQAADGTRTLLPKPGVDTGMGLERVTAVVQQAASNYDTDLFRPLLDRVQQLLGHDGAQREEFIVPYRVIADHSRAATFLLADGVTPGNEGRAYVLRMILRRAIRFGRRAGFRAPFLGEIAKVVIDQFGQDSPELTRRRHFIVKMVTGEEERFDQTLSSGLERLAELIDAVRARGEAVIPGTDVFRLYDTYGFPIEMTRDVAAEAGLPLDEAGFHQAMEEQRHRSRAGGGLPGEARAGAIAAESLEGVPPTAFVGYTRQAARATVLALFKGGTRVRQAGGDDEVVLVLDRTPFYAEAGGQVGDTGTVTARGLRVEITDTRRVAPGITGHIGRVTRGLLREGAGVGATVDSARRAAIKRNHTATHLLHQALQEVLGAHAHQAGSLVAPDRLRFDFTHAAPLEAEERRHIERRVNEMVLAARPVRAVTMPLEQARRLGAKALFGEKYGEQVRVVTVKDISRELCGGTHLANTGEIGSFVITSDGGVAAGIRRIEAVTGWGAYERAHMQEQTIADLAAVLQTTPDDLGNRVRRLVDQVRVLERERRERGHLRDDPSAVARTSVTVEDVPVTTARIDEATPEALRLAGDRLRDEQGRGVFVLGGMTEGRVNVIVMVTPDLHARGLRADTLVRAVAARLGGTGGGRADLAQGGGRDVQRLDEALGAVADDVRRLVGAG